LRKLATTTPTGFQPSLPSNLTGILDSASRVSTREFIMIELFRPRDPESQGQPTSGFDAFQVLFKTDIHGDALDRKDSVANQ
ncbi:hypothetical protein BKA83DRAFT_685419, partial [Pisolithus microcarpus]